MTKTRTWGARAAAVAAAVGLLVGAAGVVNAQPADGVDVAFNIAPGGTLSITGLAEGVAIPVPDPNPAQVAGSWSPTTGEFLGNLTGAIIPVPITAPLAVTIEASLTANSVAGTIPPDGSEGEVAISGLTLNLVVPGLVNCALPVGDVGLVATLAAGPPVGLSLAGLLEVSVSPLPAGCELLATLLPPGTEFLPVELALSLAQVGVEPTPEPEPEPAPEPEVAKPAFTG